MAQIFCFTNPVPQLWDCWISLRHTLQTNLTISFKQLRFCQLQGLHQISNISQANSIAFTCTIGNSCSVPDFFIFFLSKKKQNKKNTILHFKFNVAVVLFSRIEIIINKKYLHSFTAFLLFFLLLYFFGEFLYIAIW